MEVGVSGECAMAWHSSSAASAEAKDATNPRLSMGMGKVRKLRRVMTPRVPSEPMRSL